MNSDVFSIELAGIPARFSFSGDAGAAAEIKKRYRKFGAKGDPAVLFETSFGPGRQSPYRPEIFARGRSVRLKRGDFDCVFDAGSGAGRLVCRPAVQSFDSFLRAFYSRKLLRSGGMMLHSAGLVKNGRAYIFLGRSGAGKSTLSRLAAAAGAEVISDEINLLRTGKGGLRAYGSPFWGELRAGGRQGSWPVGGVLLLKKAAGHRLAPCSGPEAFKLLLRCLVNFSRTPEDAAAAMKNSAGLLARTGFARLEFSKQDAGFLDLDL